VALLASCSSAFLRERGRGCKSESVAPGVDAAVAGVSAGLAIGTGVGIAACDEGECNGTSAVAPGVMTLSAVLFAWSAYRGFRHMRECRRGAW
jgi:hypothetical protein